MIEDHFSEFFTKAEDYSKAWQGRYLWSERVQLLALVAAAIAANFGGPGLVVSAVALAAALSAQVLRLVTKADERWWDGRAAAESARSLCWVYVVGGHPLPAGMADAELELARRLKVIADEVADVAPIAVSVATATPEMRAARALPPADRVDLYQRDRIQHQMDWYCRESERNASRRNLWVAVAIALQGVALGLAMVFVALDVELDAIGVLTSASSAVVAWSAVKRHATLARSFAVASNELSVIEASITARSWTDWATFVHESEEVLRREHTSWRATAGV